MLRVVFILFMFVAFTAQAANPGPSVTKLGQRSYYFYKQEKNAFEAEAYCRRLGMTLVSIESQEELDLIAAHLVSMGYKTKDWWITSGSDNSQEGTWVWTGTGRNLNFAAWYNGQPNNFNGDENCLHMSLLNQVLIWNDGGCDIPGKFICEQPSLSWGQ